MEVKLWLQHIDKKELTRSITLPTSEINMNLFEYSNGGIQKFNKALNELNALATTDEVIALTELYPQDDIYEILEYVKEKQYEFYPNKNFNDIVEEFELDNEITIEELVNLGYSQLSTGIIKEY